MDDNAKYQIHHILGKTRQMVEYLRTSRVAIREAWYTFTSVFLKTIEYPMETTRLAKT